MHVSLMNLQIDLWQYNTITDIARDRFVAKFINDTCSYKIIIISMKV